jgi:hypothetical protein
MTKLKISKPIDDDEFEPPDPDAEEALAQYVAMLKGTMPSEETIKALFEASGGNASVARPTAGMCTAVFGHSSGETAALLITKPATPNGLPFRWGTPAVAR